MNRRAAALAAAMLAGPLVTSLAAQTPQRPPGLTPLGPVQAPRPSAPTQPMVIPGQDPPAPIQSQSLPSLTAPDPAYIVPPAGAVKPAAPAPTAPPAQASAPAAAPSPLSGDWQSRPGVELRGLDKVTARSTVLTGKVGETLRYGTLSITLRGCVTRPPDQPADVAAFLEITDRGSAAPVFRGWMIASAPSSAIIEHPVYDVRVAACRP